MPVFDQQETRKPPISQIGAVLWLKTNLFSSWINSVLTLASLYLLYILIPPLLNWMVFDASFSFGTVNFFGFEIKFSEEINADYTKIFIANKNNIPIKTIFSKYKNNLVIVLLIILFFLFVLFTTFLDNFLHL